MEEEADDPRNEAAIAAAVRALPVDLGAPGVRVLAEVDLTLGGGDEVAQGRVLAQADACIL
jgi:hypothetical protein